MVQKDGVSACAWKDRKVVMAMFTNTQPSSKSSVLRRQKDATRTPVSCPESILLYNMYMGGVDRGDQLRGYYSCRTKSRKFYRYVFYFLYDVAITNAYVLQKNFCPDNVHKNIKHKAVPTAVGTRANGRLLQSSTSWSQAIPHRHSSSQALSSEGSW